MTVSSRVVCKSPCCTVCADMIGLMPGVVAHVILCMLTGIINYYPHTTRTTPLALRPWTLELDAAQQVQSTGENLKTMLASPNVAVPCVCSPGILPRERGAANPPSARVLGVRSPTTAPVQKDKPARASVHTHACVHARVPAPTRQAQIRLRLRPRSRSQPCA